MECKITVNEERLIGTAKWDDILKLYVIEKRNVYRLLPKENDIHIKPSGQVTMNVNLDAQVISSTVVAAIGNLVTVGKENRTEFE